MENFFKTGNGIGMCISESVLIQWVWVQCSQFQHLSLLDKRLIDSTPLDLVILVLIQLRKIEFLS